MTQLERIDALRAELAELRSLVETELERVAASCAAAGHKPKAPLLPPRTCPLQCDDDCCLNSKGNDNA